MTKTIFSLKTLAACWGGLLVAAGSGAVALQLTMPPPVAAVPEVEAPVAVAAAPVVPNPVPSMPFENRSLVAMLPPAMHPALRATQPLPVPPVPPTRHVVRAEPHRLARMYAADPSTSYEPADWAPRTRYRDPYPAMQLHAYIEPPSYYGW